MNIWENEEQTKLIYIENNSRRRQDSAWFYDFELD